MSDDATRNRSEGRYSITSAATRVTVTLTDSQGSDRTLSGQLADLSLRGLRLIVDGRIEPQEVVDLRVEIPRESITFQWAATIRWQQPRDTKTWWTGCELLQPLEHSVIERLAAAHVLNRRRDPRHLVDKPAQVRTELSSQLQDVRIVNYSKGGFCVVCNQPLEFPHERLMLMIGDNDRQSSIAARVMWRGEMNGAFAVGCAYMSLDGFVRLREYVQPEEPQRRLMVRRRSVKISAVVVICLLITIALQASWLLHSHPGLGQSLRRHWAEWFVAPSQPPPGSDHDGAQPPGDTDRAG